MEVFPLIKSILAKLENDDGMSFIYVLVPLTEKLVLAITKIKAILASNEECFSEVVMDGTLVSRLSFPSEQFEATFKEDALDLNTCKLINYPLKPIDRVHVDLHINQRRIRITASDKEDYSYGHVISVGLMMTEVIPET
jgi:hypothetical protein